MPHAEVWANGCCVSGTNYGATSQDLALRCADMIAHRSAMVAEKMPEGPDGSDDMACLRSLLLDYVETMELIITGCDSFPRIRRHVVRRSD